MLLTPDPNVRSATRAQVLRQLQGHLESAEELTRIMRHGLARGDVEAIHVATSRLESVALEFKLLAREVLATPAAGEADEIDPELSDARRSLEKVATRVACSSAVASGVLERLVMVSRSILAQFGGHGGDTYLPSGKNSEGALRGVRMTERA